MNFIHETNAISLYNEQNNKVAGVEFPQVTDNIVNVTTTYVSEEMQGQGIAGKLMKELVENLKKTNRKAIPTCTYTRNWFAKHPEYEDLIVK